MQIQIWSDMNWRLILSLVVVSGVLAYLGDVLGMKIGKRRISLFGLRPRDTSRVITALTGMVISVAILVTMSVISDNVRTALFSMKFIQGQLQQLTKDLQQSRDEAQVMSLSLMDSEKKLKDQQEQLSAMKKEMAELSPQLQEAQSSLLQARKEKEQLEQEKKNLSETVSELKSEAEALRKGLIQVRSGKIAVFANEVLGQSAIDPMSSRSDVEAIFQDLRRQAEAVVAARTDLPPSQIVLAVDISKEMESIESCVEKPQRLFVRSSAEDNAVFGEDIRLKYDIFQSRLIYHKGEILYVQTLVPGTGDFNAEAELHLVLRMVNRKAVGDSVKPNPATGTVGALDATAFFDAVEKIGKSEGPVTVEIAAADDIYTEGPVRVDILIRSGGA